MKNYFLIFKALLKSSAIADLEFRANIFLKIFTDVIWYVAQISVFEVLFRHATNLSGWTLETTRIFLGVLFLSDAIYMFLFHENLDKLSDRVSKGELDLILAKPVNSQFMLSLYRMNTAYVFNMLLVFAWLIYCLNQLPGSFPFTGLLALFILLPASVMIVYAMRMFFCTLAIIFVRADNIVYFWYQLYRLATRPDGIYPNWLRYAILFVLPLGLIASIPTRLLVFEESLWWIVWTYLVAFFINYLCHRFWNYALTKYSSASS